jgi:AcrR family transcriptional regulator
VARKKSLDDGPVLRGEILAQATRLFGERGFGATSIRDIADAVGISSSTLYHHFANKQDVLHAAVSDFLTDFVAATVPTLRDGSLPPVQRIRATVAAHIRITDERRHELLVGNPIRYALDPEHRAQGIALQTEYHDAVRATIEQGSSLGEFRVCDAGIATMAVLDMLNGIREWYSPAGPLSRDELVQRYTQLVLALLGAWPPAS